MRRPRPSEYIADGDGARSRPACRRSARRHARDLCRGCDTGISEERASRQTEPNPLPRRPVHRRHRCTALVARRPDDGVHASFRADLVRTPSWRPTPSADSSSRRREGHLAGVVPARRPPPLRSRGPSAGSRKLSDVTVDGRGRWSSVASRIRRRRIRAGLVSGRAHRIRRLPRAAVDGERGRVRASTPRAADARGPGSPLVTGRHDRMRTIADSASEHAWSPDGRWLAVIRSRRVTCSDPSGCQTLELWIVAASGSPRIRIPSLPGGEVYGLDWRPM